MSLPTEPRKPAPILKKTDLPPSPQARNMRDYNNFNDEFSHCRQLVLLILMGSIA